ncbi:LPS export ABC transporter permease LptG [Mesorhizobium sp. CAU 1741]|uniref:LPS export ABC transporter permease LptG n=1 Tax=Mesorhizobium sp. CAU 1741 TaxID=3140366 RepID=UPI00325BE530
MIGFTLGRYFFMRYLSITMWMFIGLSALIFIVVFTELADRLGGVTDYSVTATLAIAAMQTPILMQQSVPFIGLVSAIATLVALNRRYELVVTRAAGISAWQFLLPLCAGSLVFGLAAILILNPIAAGGLEQGEALEASARAGSAGSGNEQSSPWIKQRTAEGETIIGSRAVLDQGMELVDASFLRIDTDGTLVERIDARSAYLRQGHWELVGANRILAGEAPEAIESVRIDTNLTPEFVMERLANPETISIYDLPRKIAAARSFGLNANAFAMQFHSLIALPALLIAMTLIAATVSMRFARMGQSVSIILGGILAGFLLYVVTVLVQAFGSAGFVPPVAAAWFPVLVASFIGVTFLLYKEDG